MRVQDVHFQPVMSGLDHETPEPSRKEAREACSCWQTSVKPTQSRRVTDVATCTPKHTYLPEICER